VGAETIPESAGAFLPGAEFPSRVYGVRSLRVTVLQHDQTVAVAYVAGEVDMLTGPLLQKHFDKALAPGPNV
jgi:hypothetical protein